MERIDEIDAQILNLLQMNGRMKRNRIAEEVGLSLPSVSERMRKLEERGVIQGYYAVVDHKRLRMDITAFILINVDGKENYDEFVRLASENESILEVHLITGQGSHLLKVRTRDTTSLEHFLLELQSWPGVHGTSTSIVLSSYKETRFIKALPTYLVPFEYEVDK